MQIPEVNKHQDCTDHQIQITYAISNKIGHCQMIAQTTVEVEARSIYKISNVSSVAMIGNTCTASRIME